MVSLEGEGGPSVGGVPVEKGSGHRKARSQGQIGRRREKKESMAPRGGEKEEGSGRQKHSVVFREKGQPEGGAQKKPPSETGARPEVLVAGEEKGGHKKVEEPEDRERGIGKHQHGAQIAKQRHGVDEKEASHQHSPGGKKPNGDQGQKDRGKEKEKRGKKTHAEGVPPGQGHSRPDQEGHHERVVVVARRGMGGIHEVVGLVVAQIESADHEEAKKGGKEEKPPRQKKK